MGIMSSTGLPWNFSRPPEEQYESEGDMPIQLTELRNQLVPGLYDIATDTFGTGLTQQGITRVIMNNTWGETWVELANGEYTVTPYDHNASADRVEASQRGIELLKTNLTKQQLADFENHGWFDVVGGETGLKYRIKRGTHQNIFCIIEDPRYKEPILKMMCFTTVGRYVMGDVMLAQKIALECDELATLKIANFF
jgi:hypothetical protein